MAGGLTASQLRVLELVAADCSNAEVAARLHVSESTVKSHVAAVCRKFGVHSRAGAVAAGFRCGLLSGRCAIEAAR